MDASPRIAVAGLDRRGFLAFFSSIGLGHTLLPGALWAQAQAGEDLSRATVAEAAKLAGLEFTDDEADMMLRGLERNLASYEALRAHPVPNDTPPALLFDPAAPPLAATAVRPPEPAPRRPSRAPNALRPGTLDEVAFWPVTMLSELVRTRQVSSVELTRMYLDRLERHGPTLECVVHLTPERALRQADEADRMLARGEWLGPLHGIPWGAKDLLAVAGTPTTWGAAPFREQRLEHDAEVVRRLDAAGAVLVAKLTLGALAMGDWWYGGRTRNPWDLEQGSSGSSAGSGAATAAGLVGFAIGSETLGSIVSPSTRVGVTGLRPTFGRVSRAGAMALSWSMDKLGPMCRSAEDCALVLEAIHGADGRDPTARTVPFDWDAVRAPSTLRVGMLASAFAEGEGSDLDRAALEAVRSLGVDPVPVELPDGLPLQALRIILDAEAAAAFDDLTRSDLDDELVRQTAGSWPNLFRTARFIPAVEYIRANRVRTMVMGALAAAFDGFDVVLAPSFADDLLLMTNLTGHPVVVLPHGFTDAGTPASFSFVGNLWREAEALRLAKAYQDVTDHHLRRPPAFADALPTEPR